MVELSKTREFLSSSDSIYEFRIDKPINKEQYDTLSEKITKARVIAGLYGERQEYPRSLEYENEGYPIGYLKIHEINLSPETSLSLGINILEEKNLTSTDFFLHYYSPSGNIRIIFSFNNSFFMRVSDSEDRQIYETVERKLTDMNGHQYGVASELLGNFIKASDFQLQSIVK
ncbi:MAG: hypothetical protein A3B38_01475 [Candidatus Levybacteria bacterium RIFCSPLOWO2_01_FULL_36_13]|nr:MAG: hypothetical protein A2684_02710 [Candidatus Levybacteria bacterium RIFCSPHIGHO2_01_FULL_36_15b]OGH35542.1 MAG: hypothetical protein A3B38_01475 [Candidatus Levybacteria bacterium RIFCSPLOWO2_01_FULL_36_13]